MKPEQTKKVTLAQIAELTGGRLESSPDLEISGIAPIEKAKPGQITFLSGAKNYRQHLENLSKSEASAVIASEDAPEIKLPAIRLKNPYFGLVKALELFSPDNRPNYNIHPTAFVSEHAQIGEGVTIEAGAVIETDAVVGSGSWIGAQALVGRESRVGENTRIYPGVKLLDRCQVGNRCIIHANAVIGSDGFGFTNHEGRQLKVPQVGNVIIHDDVEIGACVTIDRATMESTIIGNGTKIDNMVHIAHNVIIGNNCTIVAQVGISGSTIIEDNVTLAGQVGTVGHVRIGKGTVVAARGVVTSDVEPGSFVSGFPIKPHQEERKILAALRKLPELLKKVRELEKNSPTKDE